MTRALTHYLVSKRSTAALQLISSELPSTYFSDTTPEYLRDTHVKVTFKQKG